MILSDGTKKKVEEKHKKNPLSAAHFLRPVSFLFLITSTFSHRQPRKPILHHEIWGQ